MASGEGRLKALAEGQFGSVSLAQVKACGVSEATASRRVASGAWTRPLPAVYRLWPHPDSCRQLIAESVLWAGARAYASHRAAAYLFGLHGYGFARAEVVVPEEVNVTHEQVVVHHSRLLAKEDLQTHLWPARTTLARTLVDLSEHLRETQLERVLESAWRQRRTLLTETAAALKRMSARSRGEHDVLRRLLEQRLEEPTDSELEAMVLPLLRAEKLPDPRLHYRIAGAFGAPECDFVWLKEKVILETDGFTEHGKWKKWVDDVRVRRELQELGYQVLLASWQDVTQRPKEVVRAVRTALKRTFAPRAEPTDPLPQDVVIKTVTGDIIIPHHVAREVERSLQRGSD